MYLSPFHRIKRLKQKKKKKKTKKRKQNTNLMVCPCIICLLYPLHHGGLCEDYSYSSEIISCSMLTDNDECIRVYYEEGQTLVLQHCYPFSRM